MDHQQINDVASFMEQRTGPLVKNKKYCVIYARKLNYLNWIGTVLVVIRYAIRVFLVLRLQIVEWWHCTSVGSYFSLIIA